MKNITLKYLSNLNKRKFKRTVKEINKLVRQKGLGFLLIFLALLASFLSGILFEKLNAQRLEAKSLETATLAQSQAKEDLSKLQSKVLKEKYVFKINWGDLGKKMVEDGVIDKVKLAQAITGKDTLPKELNKYFETGEKNIEVNASNAQFWVDVLWGLGLANKNKILEEGQMMQDGDASNFASTGGWTLGPENPMSVYSKYSYINLSEEQQKMVEEIAGSIYRPCCGNSTAFPDCNHGMAMLGLIELMASQGFSKDEIYKAALAFNTYWFPQTYLNTAYYLKQEGKDFEKVSPQELLSQNFSSAMGAQSVSDKIGTVEWPLLQNGGSCGA